MKEVCLFLLILCAAALAPGQHELAQGNTIARWQDIAGVATAPGIDNPAAASTSARDRGRLRVVTREFLSSDSCGGRAALDRFRRSAYRFYIQLNRTQ